jgi:hypothetical protein
MFLTDPNPRTRNPALEDVGPDPGGQLITDPDLDPTWTSLMWH